MQQGVRTLAIAAVFALFSVVAMSAAADRSAHDDGHPGRGPHVQLGLRPFYLVDKMEPSRLRENSRGVRNARFSIRLTSPSATAAAGRCSSPSTPRRATRRVRVWVPVSWSAM